MSLSMLGKVERERERLRSEKKEIESVPSDIKSLTEETLKGRGF